MAQETLHWKIPQANPTPLFYQLRHGSGGHDVVLADVSSCQHPAEAQQT